jgi:hypothetical protein
MVTFTTILRAALLLIIGAIGVAKYVSTRDPGFLVLVVALAVWPLALAVLNPLVVPALTSGALQRSREALGLSVGEVVALWSGVLGVIGSLLGLAGIVVLYSGVGRRDGA